MRDDLCSVHWRACRVIASPQHTDSPPVHLGRAVGSWAKSTFGGVHESWAVFTSAAPYTTMPAVMLLSKAHRGRCMFHQPSSQHRVVQQTTSSAITSLRAPNKPNIQVIEYYQQGRKGNLAALCSCPCNIAKAGSFSMACFIAVFGLVQCETQQLLLCN